MAASGHTTNYNLPQYASSDTTDWLTTFNGAMTTIDGQMKTNNTLAQDADDAAQGAQEIADSAQADATKALNRVAGALANEADTFSETSTYAVGDYCIYTNVLYRCIVAVTVAGEFSGDNWEVAKITDILKNDIKVVTLGDFSINTPAANAQGFPGYVNTDLVFDSTGYDVVSVTPIMTVAGSNYPTPVATISYTDNTWKLLVRNYYISAVTNAYRVIIVMKKSA